MAGAVIRSCSGTPTGRWPGSVIPDGTLGTEGPTRPPRGSSAPGLSKCRPPASPSARPREESPRTRQKAGNRHVSENACRIRRSSSPGKAGNGPWLRGNRLRKPRPGSLLLGTIQEPAPCPVLDIPSPFIGSMMTRATTGARGFRGASPPAGTTRRLAASMPLPCRVIWTELAHLERSFNC